MAKINGALPKITSAEQVDKVAEEYFKECIENEKYPTVSMFAYRLGLDRKTLLKYEHCIETGELVHLDIDVKKKIVNSIKRAKAYIEGCYEDRLLNDGRSPIGTIFTLKNNYGWVDKQEIEQTNKTITVDIEEE
ncbi:terminase small subunit [Clostridium butyricum]